MVRLEKIAYEQLVNTKALGRNRKLTTPAKWFITNPLEHMKRFSWFYFNGHPLGIILKPFFRIWFNAQRKSHRNWLLKQGLAFEDKFLHHDAELRRCIFFEHIARQSLHPYHWVIKARRRERYCKVDRGLRGFIMPEFGQAEAKTQTWRDYKRLETEWFDFVHRNYWSDITPTARRTVVPSISFDWLMNYGLWKSEAWERYFFTERDQGWYTEKQLKIVRDPKRFPLDLTTAEGRKKFEQQIQWVNKNYPGMVAPQGQSFDFKKYYSQIGL